MPETRTIDDWSTRELLVKVYEQQDEILAKLERLEGQNEDLAEAIGNINYAEDALDRRLRAEYN